jgi:putative ABC transport system substrate-binding protein
MRRRQFIALFGGAAAGSFAAAAPALAQRPDKVPRVGILTPAQNGATPVLEALRKGLADFGYVDGKTIQLDFRFAKGNIDALRVLAAELAQIPVDLIVTDATPAVRAAMEATRTIPIVMGAAADPVLLGFVASIRRPGGNVTGMTIRAESLSGKRLQLLKQACPGIANVCVLMNPLSPSNPGYLRVTREAAETLGIRIATLAAGTPEELRALNAADLGRSDALVVHADGMFWNQRATILALAQAAGRPAIYPEREYADDGGLMAYGPNIPELFRRAAGYVDRILRGAKPGDLPIDEPERFDFVVNVRAARALGVAISPDFLSAANEVIE